MPDARNRIGETWTGPGDRAIDILDPATGERVGRAPRSGRTEVDEAVRAAREALRGWSAVPAPRRGEVLFRAGAVMESRKDELARAVTREMGKPKAEAIGDVQEAVDMAFYMGGEGR